LQLYEEALALQTAALGPADPDTLVSMSDLAWLLATAPDVQRRDPPRALELARKAAELSPTTAAFWGILGTARYRSGDWAGAIGDLERAVGLRPPEDPTNAFEGFFLAMAHGQQGNQDQARQWFAHCVQWMDKDKKGQAELQRFRAEAAALLGRDKKP
jgi:tetratricopeptide (TPR) repeat protein